AQSSFDDFDRKVRLCNEASGNNGGCDVASPGLQSVKDRGEAKQTAGYVMYGVAGGALLAGAALWWLNRPESYQISSEQLEGQAVSVSPIVAPGMTGAMVQGRF